MGWCSGSFMADELWDDIRKYIPKAKRKLVANKIYDVFSDHDADCWESDMNLIKDKEINNE
jgi:hypothetical protein